MMVRNVSLVVAVLLLAQWAAAAPLLVDVSFDENSLLNRGTAGETAFLTGGATPVYVDGVGTYRYGTPSRALDLTGTGEILTLGSLATGAGGVIDALNGLQSFTITMWFKGAKLNNAVPINRRENSGQWTYNIQARTDQWSRQRAVVNHVWSDPATNGWFGYENEWSFFAMTYDGTQTVDNVHFYRNNADHGSAYVHGITQTANAGAVNVSDYPITFGLQCASVIDNIKIYGSKTDASGDLGDGVKWVYWNDMKLVEIPEPTTMLLLGVGALGLLRRK